MADTVELIVTKLSKKGEGIAFYQDWEVYIPQVLLGEKLQVELGEPFVQGSARRPGKVVQILEPSVHRVSSYPCSKFGLCGGCQYMHVNYQEQLRVKQADIAQAVNSAVNSAVNNSASSAAKNSAKLVNLSAEDISMEVVGAQNCRSKSIRYFANDSEQGLIQGFYASRSHDLVAIESCCQEVDGFAPCASSLTKLLASMGVKAQDSGAGAINTESLDPFYVKALQLRKADNELMALLIVTGAIADKHKSALKTWAQEQGLGSFYVGYNNQSGNSLYCEQVELIYGQELLVKNLLGLNYYFGPQTFMQVNYDMTQKLYAEAIEHCYKHKAPENKADEVALDLCCGVGTMTLALAQHFKQVIGVEIVDSAIELAQKNALLNNINNVSFIAADINKVLPSLLNSAQRAKVKAVIADPSRAGLGADCARLIGKIPGPCAVSLIFCSLTALKRDLPILLKAGFTITKVKGFDMFANTNHIETLVCLTKSK